MNIKKSTHISSNSVSIELTSSPNSTITENLIILLSNSYNFAHQKNDQALLKYKINFLNKNEFEELESQNTITKINVEDTILWSNNLLESYFIDEGVIRTNPKNYITYPLYLTAFSKNIAFFHAACCKLDNKIFIIIGASKSGKSSMSYLLHRQGMQIAGDDLIFIDKNIKNYKIFSNPRIVKFRSETLQQIYQLNSDSDLYLDIFDIDNPKIILIFPEYKNSKQDNFEIKNIDKKEAASLIIKNNLRISTNKNQSTRKHELFILKNSCELANDSHTCLSIRYTDLAFSKPKTIFETILKYS